MSSLATIPRRLLWSFVGLLLLSIALQVASLVAVMEIESVMSLGRQQIAAAFDLDDTVEGFENATYLAAVGLATSDWDLLLRQRTSAQGLSRRFDSLTTAMLQGGPAQLDDGEVTLASADDPTLRALLTAAQSQWERAHAAHVRVLRSENRSLKQNPDLAQFHTESEQLARTTTEIAEFTRHQEYTRMRWFGRIQALIPVAAFLLTLGIFAFVLLRILLPFATSTEELARSETALRRARDELEQRVAERTQELAQANEALRHAHDDLEVRVKERTQELRETQRRAVELARQAGMAELATNVLHNVGNVLNSLNISSTMLGERLRSLRVDSVSRLAETFTEHRADLAAFLTADNRGQRMPDFIDKLGQHLSSERTELLEMTASLQRHVEHIRMIVELQQTYALTSNMQEATSLGELVEDALRINGAALGRHGIAIERELSPLPRVMVDKHKLLQILLNLISNAKYAMDGRPPGDRLLRVKVELSPANQIRLQVKDNGMGIAPELLTKIFQHGFTTRKEGHGFGLHSCAIAARALGGALTAHSDGPGAGATFTLEFPFQPESSESTRTGS